VEHDGGWAEFSGDFDCPCAFFGESVEESESVLEQVEEDLLQAVGRAHDTGVGGDGSVGKAGGGVFIARGADVGDLVGRRARRDLGMKRGEGGELEEDLVTLRPGWRFGKHVLLKEKKDDL